MLRAVLNIILLFLGTAIFSVAEAQDELIEASLSSSEVEWYRAGGVALDEGRFEEAQMYFWRVFLTNPDHSQNLFFLGDSYLRGGELDRALEWFSKCVHLYEPCGLSLGDVQLQQENWLDAVVTFARLRTERRNTPSPTILLGLARAQLGANDLQGAFDTASRLHIVASQSDDLTDTFISQTHRFYLDLTERRLAQVIKPDPWGQVTASEQLVLQESITSLRDWSVGEPQDEATALMINLLLRLEVEASARLGLGGNAEPLDPQERELLRQVESLVSDGQLGIASEKAEVLIDVAPRSAEAWGAWASLNETANNLVQAERGYRMSVSLEPQNSRWALGLASVLRNGYGGRRDSEAIEILSPLVTVHSSSVVHRDYARLLQGLGRYDEALSAWREYVRHWPNGSGVNLARIQVTALSRRLEQTNEVDVEDPESPVVEFGEPQWSYQLSLAYLARGRLAEALEWAEIAVELEPEWVAPLNHLAELLVTEKPRRAQEMLQRSLDLVNTQERVSLRIAEIHKTLGEYDLAFEQLAVLAERLPEHNLTLSLLLEDQGRRNEAVVALELYQSVYVGPRFREEALAQATRIQPFDSTSSKAWFFLVFASSILLLGGVIRLRWRRFGGVDIEGLLAKHPRSYSEVAAVLSAMRHEVIKHNTTVLPVVADSLERGELGGALDAQGWLLNIGVNEHDGTGVLALWDRYVTELEQISLRVGVRLNIKWNDPVLSPMCRGFEKLNIYAKILHKPTKTTPNVLRGIHKVINVDGYRELGNLLRRISIFELDAKVVRESWARVCREPTFDGMFSPRLTVVAPKKPFPVRIIKDDLVDILTNLLRNALGPVGFGEMSPVRVELVMESDPITFISTAAIRIMDRREGTFNVEMIRGRSIERGLGLVYDRVVRAGGSISVEQVSGWNKAVVVRLVVVESVDNISVVPRIESKT